MNFFWTKGALFVRELLDFYDEPKTFCYRYR